MAMELLIDPDLLVPSGKDRQPAALVYRYGATKTAFGYYPADETNGPRCERCNRLLHHHLWQLVDDGEVQDCEASE